MSDLHAQIAIIGAGPSGLSAAHYLKQKGYRHITLFEKENRVGGKCCSVKVNNQYIDLGAALISPSNTNLLQLFKHFKAKVHSQIGHHLIYNPLKDSLLPIEKSEVLDHSLSQSFSSLMRFIHLSNKYRHLKRPGYINIPKDLYTSFSSFVSRHQLEPLRNLFTILMTHMGYGKLEDIPAYMAIKFLKIRGIVAFFTILLTGKNYFKVLRLSDGFQTFWEKVVSLSQFNILLQSTITAVDYKDKKIVIKDQNGSYHFDRLIIATPFDKIADKILNSTIDQHLVAKIKYVTYICHLFKINAVNAPKDNIFVVPPRLDTGPLMVVACAGPDHLYTCYSSNELKLNEEQLKLHIVEFLCQFGIRRESIEFLAVKNWQYFPHASIEDVKEGFYDEINSVQGQQQTYYVGDLLSFESVEQCVSFSKYLVNKYF
jgi:protoporphyrinogen oxidase